MGLRIMRKNFKCLGKWNYFYYRNLEYFWLGWGFVVKEFFFLRLVEFLSFLFLNKREIYLFFKIFNFIRNLSIV